MTHGALLAGIAAGAGVLFVTHEAEASTTIDGELLERGAGPASDRIRGHRQFHSSGAALPVHLLRRERLRVGER
jgi:hypothetical protein